MFLASLALVSFASATSWTSTQLANVTGTRVLSSAVMSPAGNVCLSSYDTATTSTVSYWSPGDTRPASVRSNAYTAGYDRCADVSDSGYAAIYRTSGMRTTGALYNDGTRAVSPLGASGGSVRPVAVAESGHSLGYVSASGGATPSWWGPTGGAVHSLAAAGPATSPIVGINSAGGGVYWTATRPSSTWLYDIFVYDFATDTQVQLVDDATEVLAITVGEDDRVLVRNLSYDVWSYAPDGSDAVMVELTDGDYPTVALSNAAGQLVLTGYAAGSEAAAWCWDRDNGSTRLDSTGLLYANPLSINEAGEVVGTAFDAATLATVGVYWDCATGEATWIDAPSGYSSGGSMVITDEGDIVAVWSTSASRSVVLSYDLATDTHTALLPADTGRQAIAGSNAATGDLLITSAVGRGGKVYFLDAVP